MKKLYYLIVLVLILGLVLTGCTLLSNIGQAPATEQKYNENNPNPYTFDSGDLVAGQNSQVGTVDVWNDAENLYIKYVITEDDWCLIETHLHVADDLIKIPQTKKLNPIPGQFEKNGEHNCLSEVLYTYNLKEKGWSSYTELYIAAHAVVFNETATKMGESLVANGGFEVPVIPEGSSWGIFFTDISWTVDPVTSGLELQRIWTADTGSQYTELDVRNPVKIYQDLTTQMKDSYTLTYAWSPRPGVVENIMEVWWNGTLIATHSADGSGNEDTAWTVETHTGLVPNASGLTHLEFVDIEEEIPHGSGMFLDSVSVFQEETETAWADGLDFDGKNWATYFEYEVEPLILNLYEKTPLPLTEIPTPWPIVEEGAWGQLVYNPFGSTFDFIFNGYRLVTGYGYTLIYYPDYPWPENPWPREGIICLGDGFADDEGEIHIEGSVNTGDLPTAGDAALLGGAKIWLVLSDDVNCVSDPCEMFGWHPTEYLFEGEAINFDDTDE